MVAVLTTVAGCGDDDELLIGPDSQHAVSGSGGSGGEHPAATGTGAGGYDGSEAGGFGSGSRLRARYLAGGDGSRQGVGWYDSELGQTCEFFGVGGSRHCLPGPAVVGGGISLYTNSSCSTPAVRVPDGCEETSYVRRRVGAEDCGDVGYDVFPAVLVAAPYQYNGGVCSPATGDPVAYQITGDALPLSTFVSATLMTE
jgi:hypothetical protein